MNARKPTRRKTPLLAYCEYVSADPNTSSQVWLARQQLIETTKKVCPEFLQKLSTEVFPFYLKLANDGYDFDQILGIRAELSPFELLTENGGLKSALSGWANEFNANSGWLLDEALQTLQGWYVAPDWRNSLRWRTVHSGSLSASTGERFEFRCEGWETELLTWTRYNESVRQRFEENLLEYEKKTRKLAELCGLVRAQRKYSLDNFSWFVLYQFAGLSSTEIVDRWCGTDADGVDESTVFKGIRAAAKLIGWDRLRNPQGKLPRKSERRRKIP